MRMEVFFVDQSGKVEQTNRDTVVAATDGKSVAVVIKSRDKQRLFRHAKLYRKKHLYLRIFTYAVFKAVESLLDADSKIVIDAEYPGKEHIIRAMLCTFIARRHGFFDIRRIEFDRVGKDSKAHELSVGKLDARKTIVFSDEDWKSAIG